MPVRLDHSLLVDDLPAHPSRRIQPGLGPYPVDRHECETALPANKPFASMISASCDLACKDNPYHHPPQSRRVAHLPIGSQVLDNLLEGGLEGAAITLLFGEAGSGKTHICLQRGR